MNAGDVPAGDEGLGARGHENRSLRAKARLALARRDLLEFIRDRRTLFVTLLLPMAMYPILALSSALGVRTALTDIDTRTAPIDLAVVLSGSPDLPKHLFALAMLVAGWLACTRLARPGASLAGLAGAVGLPVAAMLAFGVAALAAAGPPARASLLFGEAWAGCATGIALLSLPTFAGAILVMRGLAPTRLRLAGAAAGLLAGAAGASVFALHCREFAPPFVAAWYLLGIAVPVAAGALAGPRLLRW